MLIAGGLGVPRPPVRLTSQVAKHQVSTEIGSASQIDHQAIGGVSRWLPAPTAARIRAMGRPARFGGRPGEDGAEPERGVAEGRQADRADHRPQVRRESEQEHHVDGDAEREQPERQVAGRERGQHQDRPDDTAIPDVPGDHQTRCPPEADRHPRQGQQRHADGDNPDRVHPRRDRHGEVLECDVVDRPAELMGSEGQQRWFGVRAAAQPGADLEDPVFLLAGREVEILEQEREERDQPDDPLPGENAIARVGAVPVANDADHHDRGAGVQQQVRR